MRLSCHRSELDDPKGAELSVAHELHTTFSIMARGETGQDLGPPEYCPGQPGGVQEDSSAMYLHRTSKLADQISKAFDCSTSVILRHFPARSY